MTHPGGCKNWFEQLELWNGTSLKYEAALSTKLRDVSPIRKQKSLKLQNNKCKTCWTCISREWHSHWPAGSKLTPTRCNSSFRSTSFPLSCVKDPQKQQWKIHESLKFTLWINCWRHNSHNSEMIRNVVFTWWLSILLGTLKSTKLHISEPELPSSFCSFWNETKDSLLPQSTCPQSTCPQSSFTVMNNSTDRRMSMLALYNNLILDQLSFLIEKI